MMNSKLSEQLSQSPGADKAKSGALPGLTEAQLKDMLALHEKWLNSGGKEGKQARLDKTDLSGMNLSGAKLAKANLRKAKLSGANLQNANLEGAYLQEAQFDGAQLQNANLFQAQLSGVFRGPEELNLEYAANLQNANLIYAKLGETILRGVNLRGANLSDANLEKADLCYADFEGATLSRANFKGASFSNVKGLHKVKDGKLIDVNFDGAKGLTGDEFRRTNITGAILPTGISEFQNLRITEETSKNARTVFMTMLLICAYSVLTIATTEDIRLLTNSPSSPLPIIGTEIPIVWFYISAPILLLGIYIYLHLYLQRLWDRLATLPAIFQDGRPLHERAYPWLLMGLVHTEFKLLENFRPPLSRLQVGISIFLAWCVLPITLILFWGRYLVRHDWWGTMFHIGSCAIACALAWEFYRHCKNTLSGEISRTIKGAVVLFTGTGIAFFAFAYCAMEVPAVRANLAGMDVSIKPSGWKGQHDSDLFAVKGARLAGMDLRHVAASGAFLVNADLQNAKLQKADLHKADLRSANLQRANLSGANLRGSFLTEAILDSTNLENADLRDVIGLTQQQLETAFYTTSTKLPDTLLQRGSKR